MVVRRRDVSIGELTGEGIEIRQGLRDGERIVTAGVSRLSEGQRVKLLSGELAE
jgi:multidrug efflux pump subunit AcrA (membrane-fusion protein)